MDFDKIRDELKQLDEPADNVVNKAAKWVSDHPKTMMVVVAVLVIIAFVF